MSETKVNYLSKADLSLGPAVFVKFLHDNEHKFDTELSKWTEEWLRFSNQEFLGWVESVVSTRIGHYNGWWKGYLQNSTPTPTPARSTDAIAQAQAQAECLENEMLRCQAELHAIKSKRAKLRASLIESIMEVKRLKAVHREIGGE